MRDGFNSGLGFGAFPDDWEARTETAHPLIMKIPLESVARSALKMLPTCWDGRTQNNEGHC